MLYDLGRQPRAAHDFFVKYQDRLLFGKDSFQPDEYPYYWRVFETADEYFDYYRDYHAFWKLYGIGLPDDVLKKCLLTRTRSEARSGLARAAAFPTDGRRTRRPVRHSTLHDFVSRHRRRRIHRLASRRRTRRGAATTSASSTA